MIQGAEELAGRLLDLGQTDEYSSFVADRAIERAALAILSSEASTVDKLNPFYKPQQPGEGRGI